MYRETNNKESMGLRRALALALPGLLAIKAVFISAAAAGAPNEYHYYYNGQPIPIPLDLSRVVLYQDPDADPPPPPLEEILDDHGMDPQTIEPIPMTGWAMAGTPEWVQHASDVEDLVADLADDDRLTFTGPVFFDTELEPLIPTYHVLVGFFDYIPPDLQLVIIQDYDAGVVLDQDYCGMPNVWRLRNESRNGFTALGVANAMAENVVIEWATPDFIRMVQSNGVPNDPYFVQQWGHLAHGGPESNGTQDLDMDTAEAWNISTGSASVGIAIFDTGVELTHQDLNIEPGIDTHSRYGGDGSAIATCDNHGTTVAGIIAGILNNDIGVAGVAPDCRITSVRWGCTPLLNPTVCSKQFYATDTAMTTGLAWALGEGYKITVHSWSQWLPSDPIEEMLDLCYGFGMIHFAATGNEGWIGIPFPAVLGCVNAVGGIDPWGDGYGNYGGGEEFGIQYVAPAVDVYSTDRTGDLGYEDESGGHPNYVTGKEGTSYACPAAAAIAALVWSANPDLEHWRVEEILRETATNPFTHEPQGYWTAERGWGLVNAHLAIARALEWDDDDKPFIISEIRTGDPPPNEDDVSEYFEMYNDSSDTYSLSNLTYIVIGDKDDEDPVNSGVIDECVWFNHWETVLGQDFYTTADSEYTWYWDWIVPDYETELLFENGKNVTHMLLLHGNFEENCQDHCDLDLNDDGELDYKPWLKVLDSVSIKKDSGDAPSDGMAWWYSDFTIGPDHEGYAPSHVYRCQTTDGWAIGSWYPAQGTDTPDAENPDCEITTWAGFVHEYYNSGGGPEPPWLFRVEGYGEYGIRILTDENAEYLISKLTDYTPPEPVDVVKIMSREIGAIDDLWDWVISTLHLSVIDADEYVVSVEFPNAETTLQDVTLLRDGEVVDTYIGLDSPTFSVSGALEDSVTLGHDSHLTTEPYPLEAAATFTFANDVEIGLLGPGANITADQIEFRPSIPLIYERVQYVDIHAEGTPSFLINDEFGGKFGNAHRALGEALYDIGPQTLGLEELEDPEGEDGVSVILGHAVRVFTDFAPLPPIGNLPEGAFLRSGALGDAGGQTGSLLGGVTMEARWDGTAAVTANFSALEASGIEILAYNSQNELVGDKSFDQSIAMVAKISKWMDHLGRGGWPEPADPSAAVILAWDEDIPIILGEGPQVVDASLLVILPIGGCQVEGLGMMALRAGNGLDAFTISGETVVQTGEACPADFDSDGDVDTADLLHLLAAWGTPDGDVDDDGDTDTADLLALLAAWGECP
jgi:thermitase